MTSHNGYLRGHRWIDGQTRRRALALWTLRAAQEARVVRAKGATGFAA
jgi:hypothetical protein